MYKLYNIAKEFTTDFKQTLEKAIPDIKKTQLNIIPYIILSMILSESCVPLDMAKVLKDEFSSIQIDSVVKRIRRFFSNKLFNPYIFYQKLIMYILNSFHPKHEDKTLYITFDHMFSKSNYTVFMFTLRVGTFGVPIRFRCFKDISNNDAFKLNTIQKGIEAVSKLFENLGFNLVFLADRWFSSSKILDIIDKLGHIYAIRLKGNIIVYLNGEKVKVNYHAINCMACFRC